MIKGQCGRYKYDARYAYDVVDGYNKIRIVISYDGKEIYHEVHKVIEANNAIMQSLVYEIIEEDMQKQLYNYNNFVYTGKY